MQPKPCIISLGKINKYLFLILVGAVLLGSLTFLEGLTKFFAEVNYHPIIYSMTYSIGLSLSFIWLIIYKIRTKRRNIKEHILPKENKDEVANVHFHQKQITNKEKFLWILLASSINYFAYVFFCIYWVNYFNCLNSWGITLICMSLFSSLILKIKLYKHHYLGIIVVVVLGFTYNLVSEKFTEENFKKNYDSYLIQFMTECLISLMNVLYKYLIEKKLIISYEILFFEGLFDFLFGIITLIITTKIGVLDNFWDFIDQIDKKEILLIMAITVVQFLLYSIEMVIIDMFSPFHILLINIIREYILYFVYFEPALIFEPIYVCVGICFSIFMILVFIEVVELNFCGLSYMTKKNIEIRAQLDAIMEDTDDESNKNKKINIQGYIVDIRDDNPLESKEMDYIDENIE